MVVAVLVAWVLMATGVSVDASRRYGYWAGWMIGTMGFGVVAFAAYLVYRFTHQPTVRGA